MKIDPKDYIIHTTVIDGTWQELFDVKSVRVEESTVMCDGDVVRRVIHVIMVDCIIRGTVTLLFGSAEQFNFARR